MLDPRARITPCLTFAPWASAKRHGTDVARRIQTGTIGVIQYLPDPAAPFGGVKGSGLGRELGPEGLVAYQQLQSI
jgi:acyl-CoA reductase-like NAD-dependent aldehyde dehydrogenase